MTSLTSLTARARTLATMLGLVVVLLVGVAWAWAAVTEPFPEDEEATTCTSTSVAEGEKVYPDQVTVSVLNGGDREGLANRTMTELVNAGLDKGDLGNAPEDTDVSGVQIWAENPKNPAVRLVVSFLGKDAKVVRREPPLAGVNVVVGENFPGVTEGRKSVAAQEDSTICGPSTDDL